MHTHRSFSICFLLACMAFFAIDVRASSSLACADLFSGPSVQALPVKKVDSVVLTHVRYPQFQSPQILSQKVLWAIFADLSKPGDLGAAALGYVKTLKGHTADQMAQIWFELTEEIRRRNPVFTSYMSQGENHRYLFRGGRGESLFIDSDGVAYRTKTEAFYSGESLQIDYSTMRRITPPLDQ